MSATILDEETLIKEYNTGMPVTEIEKKYGYKKGGLGWRIKNLRKLNKIISRDPNWDNGVLSRCQHPDCLYLTSMNGTPACYYIGMMKKPRPCPPENCEVYKQSTTKELKQMRKDLFLCDIIED